MLLINNIFHLIFFCIDAYIYIIIAYCLFSMIIGFGLVSFENRFAMAIFETLSLVVEPGLAPIRAIMPDLGMMDFSPLVLLLVLQFLLPYILNYIHAALLGLYGV